MDAEDDRPLANAIVIDEDRRVAHFLNAFLVSCVLVGWWALNTFVDLTSENQVAVHVMGAVGTAIFGALWIYQARYPARLEVSRDSIVEKRLGRTKTVVIPRTTGDLTFDVRAVQLGRHATVVPVLRVPDDDRYEIGVATYDRTKLRQACEAVGWRFVGPSEPRVNLP